MYENAVTETNETVNTVISSVLMCTYNHDHYRPIHVFAGTHSSKLKDCSSSILIWQEFKCHPRSQFSTSWFDSINPRHIRNGFILSYVTHIVEKPIWTPISIISIDLHSCYCSNVVSLKNKFVNSTTKKQQVPSLLLFKSPHMHGLENKKNYIAQEFSRHWLKKGTGVIGLNKLFITTAK